MPAKSQAMSDLQKAGFSTKNKKSKRKKTCFKTFLLFHFLGNYSVNFYGPV